MYTYYDANDAYKKSRVALKYVKVKYLEAKEAVRQERKQEVVTNFLFFTLKSPKYSAFEFLPSEGECIRLKEARDILVNLELISETSVTGYIQIKPSVIRIMDFYYKQAETDGE